MPNGIKAPGWDVDNVTDYMDAAKMCGLKFISLDEREYLMTIDYANIRTFGYTNCIHEDFKIDINNDIILHAHIHPSQGKNGLTDTLINHIISKLIPIKNEIRPVFLKECI
jgi:hypothetical protein